MAEVETLSRLFRVRKTVTKMLEDRGYIVPAEEKKQTLDDFRQKYGDVPNREQLAILATKRENIADKIFVFFVDTDSKKKMGITEIKKVTDRMDKEDVKQAIIIIPYGITPFAVKAIQTLSQVTGKNIEIFAESKLLVNITEHVLVPKHQVLTDDEKSKVLERYKLKPSQLPRMKVDDPIARYYGLKAGQVVKIIRPSETAGKYVTYRLVARTS